MSELKHTSFLANFNILQEALTFDPQKGEITAANSDWLLIRGTMFRDFINSFDSIFGSGGRIVLDETGRMVGRNFVSNLLERGLQSAEIPTVLELLLNQGGWGKATVKLNMESCSGNIIIENCAVTRCIKSREPSCYFLKGHFQGSAEKIFGVNVVCVETACMTKGDSACIFQIQPRTQ